jgi:chromosome segregation ATPase
MDFTHFPVYVYILTGLAALLLTGGMVYVIRSLRDDSFEEIAVPISNFQEIENLKKEFSGILSSDGKGSGLTGHLLKENLSIGAAGRGTEPTSMIQPPAVDGAARNGSLTAGTSLGVNPAESRAAALEKECQRLKEALEREISSKDAVVLSEEEKSRFEEQSSELLTARSAVVVLTEENQKIKSKLVEMEEACGLIESSFAELRNQHHLLVQQKQQQLAVLKRETGLAQQQARAEWAAKAADLENLQSENRVLEDKLRQSQSQVKELIRELASTRLQREQLTHEFKALQSELQSGHSAVEQEQAGRIAQFKKALQELELEKSEIADSYKKLQDEYNRVKAFNAQLVEKGKLLQYELTKHRAQALGLEKICEDFRGQIDRRQGAGLNPKAPLCGSREAGSRP